MMSRAAGVGLESVETQLEFTRRISVLSWGSVPKEPSRIARHFNALFLPTSSKGLRQRF